MKTIKLQARKGRWPKGQKWKITSIRIPWPEVAQGLEKRSVAAGVRSPSDAIIQVLAAFVAGTPAPRKKVKLVWALKPDASARKQYAAKKPVKAVKKAAKKVARKVKTVAKRAAKAVTDPKRAAKNKHDRDRRAKIKAAAEAARTAENGSGQEQAQPDGASTVTNSEVAGLPATNEVEGLTA